MNQIDKAHILRDLHVKGDPLTLFNIWDAGSARALQNVGAKVIATSSWSVAAAQGFDDGEKLPFDFVLANVNRIVANIDLPLTVDLEGGYGQNLNQLKTNIEKIIETGVAGINFEGQVISANRLYSIAEQCERINIIRRAAEELFVPLFINARTDIFLNVDPRNHNEQHIQEAIYRAKAYAEYGADGFFVPGLMDTELIQKLCVFSPMPINIMMLPGCPSQKELVKLGVARISYGPYPYGQMIETLTKEASLLYE